MFVIARGVDQVRLAMRWMSRDARCEESPCEFSCLVEASDILICSGGDFRRFCHVERPRRKPHHTPLSWGVEGDVRRVTLHFQGVI